MNGKLHFLCLVLSLSQAVFGAMHYSDEVHQDVLINGTLKVVGRGSRMALSVTQDGHVGMGTEAPNVIGVGGRWLTVIGKANNAPGFLGLGTPSEVLDSGGITGGVNFFNGPTHAGEIQSVNSSVNSTEDTLMKIMTRTGGAVYDTVHFGGAGGDLSAYVTAGQSCRILKGGVNVVYDAAGIGTAAQATFPASATSLLVPFRSSITTEASPHSTAALLHFFHNRADLGAGHIVEREIAFHSDGKASGGTVENFAVVADNRVFEGDYFLHSASGLPSVVAGTAKFTGQLIGKGTTTADEAEHGFIGEYVEEVISDLRTVPGRAGEYADICTISLSPGDWDVRAIAYVHFGRAGVGLSPHMGISTVQGNDPTDLTLGVNAASVSGPPEGNELTLAVPTYRLAIDTTTTVFQKLQVDYRSETPTFHCRLSARRMR